LVGSGCSDDETFYALVIEEIQILGLPRCLFVRVARDAVVLMRGKPDLDPPPVLRRREWLRPRSGTQSAASSWYRDYG